MVNLLPTARAPAPGFVGLKPALSAGRSARTTVNTPKNRGPGRSLP